MVWQSDKLEGVGEVTLVRVISSEIVQLIKLAAFLMATALLPSAPLGPNAFTLTQYSFAGTIPQYIKVLPVDTPTESMYFTPSMLAS